jgi:hypothetical protein
MAGGAANQGLTTKLSREPAWRAGCTCRPRDRPARRLQRRVRFRFEGVHATSSRARGLWSATSSNVRAAPLGARRPCSQSWSVRTETPKSSANRAWESPVFSRICPTSGTLMTRPCSPRLSSRSPSRISAPISRFTLVIFRLLADLPKYMRRYRFRDILRIDRQHPDQMLGMADKVDQSVSAPLASPWRCYAELPYTARASDHRPRIRISNQLPLRCSVFIVGETLLDQASEELRLNESEHCLSIRRCRRPSRPWLDAQGRLQ